MYQYKKKKICIYKIGFIMTCFYNNKKKKKPIFVYLHINYINVFMFLYLLKI